MGFWSSETLYRVLLLGGVGLLFSLVLSAVFILATLCSVILLSGVLVLPLLWTIYPDIIEKLRNLGPQVLRGVIDWLLETDTFNLASLKVRETVENKSCSMSQPCRTRLRPRPSATSKGVVASILLREINGTKRFNGERKLPRTILQAVDRRERKIPSLVERLENSLKPLMTWFCKHGARCTGHHSSKDTVEMSRSTSSTYFYDQNKLEAWLNETVSTLNEVYRVVSELPPDLASPDDLAVDDPVAFIMHQGGDVLAQALLCMVPESLGGRGFELPFLQPGRSVLVPRDEQILYIWTGTMNILRELCVVSSGFASELFANTQFMQCAFSLMKVKALFQHALHLCEELLCVHLGVFDLTCVPAFDELVLSLPGKDLGIFCRILSCLLHERELTVSNNNDQALSLTLLRSRSKGLRPDSVLYRNEARIVANPEILRRLLHLLRLMVETTKRSRASGVSGPEVNHRQRDEVQRDGTGGLEGQDLLGGIDFMDERAFTEAQNLYAENFVMGHDPFGTGHMDPVGFLNMFRDAVQGPLGRRQIGQILFLLLDARSKKILQTPGNDWDNIPESVPIDQVYNQVELEFDYDVPRSSLSSSLLHAPFPPHEDSSVGETATVLSSSSVSGPELEGSGSVREMCSNVYAGFQRAVQQVLSYAEDSRRVNGSSSTSSSSSSSSAASTSSRFPNRPEEGRLSTLETQLSLMEGLSHSNDHQMLNWVTQEVEILFVLALVAGGKQKDKVNKLLASYGLVDVLNELFDLLDWDRDDYHTEHNGIHGAQCECNPLSARKIQYLRLIHHFCDREGSSRKNKRLLLSPLDLKVCNLLRMDREEGMRVALEVYADKDLEKGLLHKLVQLLQTEDPNSQYRFWIASTIEAFLRGSAPEEQLLVTSWGLMDHLVVQLVDNGFKSAGMLQTNFDLFGEVIKFNRTQFELLDQRLTAEQYQRLLRLVMTHLVDSNVFMRTVMVSLERFREQDAAFVQANQFEQILSQHRIEILRSLMTVVSLESVSQENISCLNTALLILMLAHRRGKLAQFLQAVDEVDHSRFQSMLDDWRMDESITPSSSDHDCSSTAPKTSSSCGDGHCCGTSGKEEDSTRGFVNQGAPPLVNYRRLLWFWRQYYLQFDDRDREALAMSTRIPFEDWVEIVNILCADDGSSTALMRKGQMVNVPNLLAFID